MYDSKLKQCEAFGGSRRGVEFEDNDTLTVDRLKMFISGSQSYLMSMSCSLLAAVSADHYDRWKPAKDITTRWESAMHEHLLRRNMDKKLDYHQLIMEAVSFRIRRGDGRHPYVLQYDTLYKRQRIVYKIPLTIVNESYESEYVCRHCGLPESEHNLKCLGSERKKCVFERMMVQVNHRGQPVEIETPCYEKLETMTRYVNQVCSRRNSGLYFSSTHRMSCLDNLVDQMLNRSEQHGIRRLKTR